MMARKLYAKLGLDFDDTKLKEVEEILARLEGALTRISLSAMTALSKLLDFVKELASALDRFAEAFEGFKKAGIDQVIKPLVEQFNAFISENSVKLAEKIRSVFDEISQSVQVAWKAMLGLVESVRGFLETFGGLEKIASILGTIASALDRFAEAFEGLKKAGIDQVIKPLVEQFNAFISENSVKLVEKIRSVFDEISQSVQIAWKAMLGLVESVRGFLETFGELEKIASILRTIADVFLGGKLLSGISSVLLGIVTTAFSKLFGFVKQLTSVFDGAADAFESAKKAAIDQIIKPLIEQFNAFISENSVKLVEKIRSVFDGIAQSVQIASQAMLALVESVGGFLDTLGGLEKIASILRRIADVFLSGKLLYVISLVVLMMWDVVLAVWAAVVAFNAMNLAALAVLITIYEIDLAVRLLINDIIILFLVIESYFGNFLAIFSLLGKVILQIFLFIDTAVMYVISALSTIFDWVMEAATVIEDFLTSIFSVLDKAIDFVGGKFCEMLGQFDTAGDHDLLNKNASPTSSPTTSTSNVQAPVHVDSNMTFNVASNVDPTTLAPKLQSSIDEGFAVLIRKTNSSYVGEGALSY